VDRTSFYRGFVDELEKRGFGPITSTVAGGVAGHALVNTYLRQMMSDPRFFPDIMRQGYRHGMAGQQAPSSSLSNVNALFGPEVNELYNMARGAGEVEVMRRQSPEHFERYMNASPQERIQMVKGLEAEARKVPAAKPHATRLSRLARMVETNPQMALGGLEGLVEQYMPKVPEKGTKGVGPKEIRNIQKEIAKIQHMPPEFYKILRQAAVREKLDRPITLGSATGESSLLGRLPRKYVKRALSKVEKATKPASGEIIGVKEGTKGSATAKNVAKGLSVGALGAAAHGVPVVGPILAKGLAHTGTNLLRQGLAHSELGNYLARPGIDQSRAGIRGPAGRTVSWLGGSPLLEQVEKATELAGRFERAGGRTPKYDTRGLGRRILADVGSWLKKKIRPGVPKVPKPAAAV